jgi:hypothetical protein
MARILNLDRSSRRTGSDARDEFDNRYELKTVTTVNVTTARDVGLPYLERLRHSYFICARGTNTDFGFNITDIYFLSPAMMEGWILSIEARLSGDRDLVDGAITVLQGIGFEGDLGRLRQLGYRGLTINNPKIPWAYITSHGVRLTGNPALHLRDLIREHPLDVLG